MHHLNGALAGPDVTSVGYTRCSGCRSVYLCATSLQIIAVQQDFIPLSVSMWNDFADFLFDGAELTGFKIRANAFSLA